MHDESQETADNGRREFLKKAGAVAWVVPTLQIVNMASASAQTNGSMVTTTPAPSTTTTTSTTSTTSTTTTTTTTMPPDECDDYFVCRIKADWENGYIWGDGGVGANDCLGIPEGGSKCNGLDIGASTGNGNERDVTVTVPEDCEILAAYHKAGAGDFADRCFLGTIAADKRSARFLSSNDGDNKDISHVELVVKCCRKRA